MDHDEKSLEALLARYVVWNHPTYVSSRLKIFCVLQVIAAIAEIELPLGQWPELIPIFLENVQSDDAVLKVATLQAIGYVCEQTVNQSSFSFGF